MDTALTAGLDRFGDLFVVVEDLIKRVADTDDLKIRHMRARLREDLIELKSDMTPIKVALGHEYRLTSTSQRMDASQRAISPQRTGSLGQPALAVLTGVAIALTVLRP